MATGGFAGRSAIALVLWAGGLTAATGCTGDGAQTAVESAAPTSVSSIPGAAPTIAPENPRAPTTAPEGERGVGTPVDGDSWDPNLPDPNLSEEYTPLRAELVTAAAEGPRIAISDLNDAYTYDYGTVPMDALAEHEFAASNAGDQDLIISRIYASCGCTATVFGGVKINDDGFLPDPVLLKPGESRQFIVQFDPRAEGKAVTQAKYIQIYSNDATRFHFDDADPLAYEVRFRIVVTPE